MRMRGTPIWTCWFRRELLGSARLARGFQVWLPLEPAGDVQNEGQIGFSDDAIWKEIGVHSKGT
jgi:hypothetical protein